MNSSLEQIYNQWLASSRSGVGLPFRIRKDFSDFEKDKNYPFLLRLENFFTKNPEIDIKTFFDAPYKVWTDTKVPFNLEYYASRKAINAYVLYKKMEDKLYTDDIDNIRKTLLSIVYIRDLMKSKNMPFMEYINLKNGLYPQYCIDAVAGKVNVYAMCAFPQFKAVHDSIPYDSRMMLPTHFSDIEPYMNRYTVSKLLRPTVEKAIAGIK